MAPDGAPRIHCPTCGVGFTKISLRDHQQASHLGVICHFPESTLTLPGEDDRAMTAELLRANEGKGGGKRGDGRYWCMWPDCSNGPNHSYKDAQGLSRHLRIKQRNLFTQSLGTVRRNAPDAAQASKPPSNKTQKAWAGVRLAKAIRNAKCECLKIITKPMDPPNTVGTNRLSLMIKDVQIADSRFEKTIAAVQKLTSSASNMEDWNDFNMCINERREHFERFEQWALLSNRGRPPCWDEFDSKHKSLDDLLEKLEASTS